MFPFFLKSKKRRELEKKGLATSKKRLKQEETISHAINKSRFVSLCILACVWFFCALVLIIPSGNKLGFYLVLGQQAPKTIHANFDFAYLSQSATKKKRAKQREAIPLIYELNINACKQSINSAKNLLKEISDFNKKSASGITQKAPFPDSVIKPLVTILNDPDKLTLFNEKLSTILYKGIISLDELNAKDRNNTKICIVDSSNNHIRPPQPLYTIPTPVTAAKNFAYEVSLDYSPQNRLILKKALYDFSLRFLKQNLKYSKRLTDVERDIVTSSDRNNVYIEIYKRDIIIKKGEKITPYILERFNAYEKEANKKIHYVDFWEDFSYNIIMSLILVILTGIYFYNLHPKVLQSNQQIATIAAVIIISVLCIMFADQLFNILVTEYNLSLSLKTCLIPLGLTSILLSVLVGLRAATFASLLVALIAAIKLDSYFVVILSMGISCISAYVVYESKNYKEYFIRAVLSVSVLFIAMEFFGQLKLIIQNPNIIPIITGLSFLNGLITAVISLAILFSLESLFQISTDMSLLSLCDYNHPLLKRLQLEAPGTYHHCLVVATLAEQAANAIPEASPIKARVCALFHDIGKLAKPEYFTENNIDTKSRHGSLRPGMSCMIIMNHVKEGVNLAIKYKLNRLIRDAIQEHHGTDFVYYFYRRALDENNEKTRDINENEYRYPGPKPYEKEIVLVSLADACEAVSRTLTKATPSKVEAIVGEIIRKRVREGQLDNADLTFQELAQAKKSFVKTLNSMLHTRINYPTDEESENEGDLFQAARENSKDSKKRIPDADKKDNGTS